MPAMNDADQSPASDAATALCPRCGKSAALCVCVALQPVENRIAVVILQHPQEQDRILGTALIAHRQLVNSRLVVGLSWPSLAAALGHQADPRRWGVLYLGPVADAGDAGKPLYAVGADGAMLDDQAAVLAALEGIILLDGSWGQAKALWWRNPWLLKLRRLILVPRDASLYGALRHEPRRDSVSTIEAAAFAVAALQGQPDLARRILRPFALLLERYRTTAPPPRPRLDRRRKR
jgi:DTW domain-containing protein YfiP